MPDPLTTPTRQRWQMGRRLTGAIPDSFFDPARFSTSAREKPLGDLCLEIAEFAKDRDYRTLDYLMRMAAAEAYDRSSDTLLMNDLDKAELIGFWEWDVSTNLAYADPSTAKLFDVDPKISARGIPVEDYFDAIHPDDVKCLTEALYRATKEGGCFNTTYRIINNDRLVWVYARGSCFVDREKTPVRFPGALFDITASMKINAEP